jgi:hypothetical protein
MKKTLIVFCFFLIGCVSSQKSFHYSPVFDGGVIPIQIPIQPRYMPCEYQISAVMEFFENQNKTEKSEVFGESKIQKFDDNLLLSTKINKMTVDGETIQGKLPIIDAQFLITTYGAMLKKEILFPLFANNAELHDKLLTLVDESFLFSQHGTFPQNKIATGDYLISIDILDSPIGTKLKGYSYYNGKKVIVGGIDEMIPYKALIPLFNSSPEVKKAKADMIKVYGKAATDHAFKNSFEDKPDIIIKGYILLDSDTFFPVKQVMTGKQDGNLIIRGKFEAEKI